eukprot:c29843_g1_i1 orf=300-503(-)
MWETEKYNTKPKQKKIKGISLISKPSFQLEIGWEQHFQFMVLQNLKNFTSAFPKRCLAYMIDSISIQ